MAMYGTLMAALELNKVSCQSATSTSRTIVFVNRLLCLGFDAVFRADGSEDMASKLSALKSHLFLFRLKVPKLFARRKAPLAPDRTLTLPHDVKKGNDPDGRGCA